nr:T9SS type A sorting domain-containing protein [Bacteroidota bacterium]
EDNSLSNFGIKAYPNPATKHVTMELSLNEVSKINLGIFDLMGRKITDLSSQEKLSTGSHYFNWNTTGIDPGVYLYKLDLGNNSITEKIIVTR